MSYQGEQPSETFRIRTATDLDNLASGGVITIATSTQLIFENIASITTTTRFDITAGTLFLDSNGGPKDILYVGGGTYFTISGTAGLDQNEVNINGATSGTLFASTTTGQIEIDNSNYTAWADVGSIVGAVILALRNTQFIVFTAGLDIDVSNFVGSLFGGVALAVPSTPLFNVSSKDTTPNMQVQQVGSLGAPFDLFRIDPGIAEVSRFIVQLGAPTGALFDTSGATGTFTAVADATIASTTITSVTDNSGVARFNFTGPTVYVNQEVTVASFVTNTTYNGTGIVTATDGTTWFEYRREYTTIAFTGTEASVGTFTSDSVTMTETGTALINGDSLSLNTDDNTDYDTGTIVYNVLTNSFQVNKAWTQTRTGTWSMAGLDQTDKRVLSFFSPALPDSKYLGALFANDLNTATTGIVNNTFQDIVFGTAGSGLLQGSSTQRFKLISDTTGIIEYTANEPFDGEISYNFSVVSSGGNQLFRVKWVVDRAPRNGTFIDLDDNVEALTDIGATASSVTKTQSVTLSKGDQLKPQVTRNAGTSDITARYVTINIFQ